MKAILIALLAGLCWGIGESFTKSVLHTGRIGPVTAMAVRTTVALPVLWLAAWFVMMRLQQEPRGWLGDLGWPTALKLALGSGLMAGAAGMLLFYTALSLGDLSTVKPIAFATAMGAAVVAGWLVFRDPMPVRKIVAVALIAAGILLMVERNPTSAAEPIAEWTRESTADAAIATPADVSPKRAAGAR
ncbi:MAG: DMT family transporter [Pseudomonadales bacterium]|jgi:transporter family protein|nr:DMT family transporter [Pseudomonadales bacterium]